MRKRALSISSTFCILMLSWRTPCSQRAPTSHCVTQLHVKVRTTTSRLEPCQSANTVRFLDTFPHAAGVPVYLAPWTACPPGGKPTAVNLPPGEKLSRDILPPTLVIFTPGGQAVQAGLSRTPPNTSKIYIHVILLFFCIILMNSDPP